MHLVATLFVKEIYHGDTEKKRCVKSKAVLSVFVLIVESRVSQTHVPRIKNRSFMTLMRNTFCCVVLLTIQVDLVEAQDAGEGKVQTPQSETSLTLEELKAEGALLSKYLQQTQPELTAAPEPQLETFKQEIQGLLKASCVDCHGEETQEGNIRIDSLDPDLLHGDDVNWWLEVLAVLTNGEMPPEDNELNDEDRQRIINWLSREIQVASMIRRAEQGHSSFRRMTRYEYNYALQDVLGLPYNFAKDLPPDPVSGDGFQNSSETLQISPSQLETYRELSRKALLRATVSGPQPEPFYWGVTMKAASAREWEKQNAELEKAKQKHQDDPETLKGVLEKLEASFQKLHKNTYYQDLSSGRTARSTWRYSGAKYAWSPTKTQAETPAEIEAVAIIPPRRYLIVELGDQIPESGTIRVRVRASRASEENDRIPSMQLEFGWQASNDSHASVRISKADLVVDALPGNPKFYQWDVPVGDIYPRNSVRKISKMGDLPSPSEYIKLVNSSVSQGDIQIDYVEVIAPVYKQWPPASHTRIFFTDEHENDETTYAKKILQDFMPRVWRREVTAEEIEKKLELLNSIRPDCSDFQSAMIEVLANVLASPNFLYLVNSSSSEEESFINQYELATRLSMFLWCSTPDEELLSLAAKGELNSPEGLKKQVKRMLTDGRSERFSQQFVHQWLNLELLEFLKVDRKDHPHFDPTLKEAMLREPVAFFDHLLQNNESVMSFLHSDYTLVNERLAQHYGLPNVHGNQFRPFVFPAHLQRGGLLTHAGLLAMNSDGKDSHPLKRGIWLLDRILNDPPPPPPPAVPEIDLADAEIAKLTLKQRIEDHRNHAACMSCHAKIDPWGIAFENFDATGSWRTMIDGKPVEATSALFNKQELAGIDGLKKYLLINRQDQFARALTHKMTTFALGRPLTFADRSRVDRITAELRKHGDGLEDLVTLIVISDLFRSK